MGKISAGPGEKAWVHQSWRGKRRQASLFIAYSRIPLMKVCKYLSIPIIILAAFLATAYPALATLGKSTDSIKSDAQALSAAEGTTKYRNGYSVREISSSSFTIREYATLSDIIFGIAWNGMTKPDLAPLLGSYMDEYRKALQVAPRERGRPFSRIETNQIVVEQWGLMRDLHGRAYVLSLMPAGVTPRDIK